MLAARFFFAALYLALGIGLTVVAMKGHAIEAGHDRWLCDREAHVTPATGAHNFRNFPTHTATFARARLRSLLFLLGLSLLLLLKLRLFGGRRRCLIHDVGRGVLVCLLGQTKIRKRQIQE